MAAVATLARFVVGLTFVVAGVAKVGRTLPLEQALWRYGLVPGVAIPTIARWLPVCEISLGVLLVVGLWIGYAAAAVVVFLFLFSSAIALNLVRGRVFDCGCGLTASREPIGWAMVLRNAVLAGTALLAAIFAPSPVYAAGGLMHVDGSTVGAGAAGALFGAAVISLFTAGVTREAARTYQLTRKLSTTSTVPLPTAPSGRV